MSGSIVGKILLCVIVVILCFIIGVQAAESIVSSMTVVMAVVGTVFMLIMGPRSWMLIFLLPPLVGLLPGPFRLIHSAYVVAPAILVYWIIMWGMGYVRIRWRSMWLLDILVFLSLAMMVAAYIKRPVSVQILGLDTDYIGGRVFVWAIGACIYYMALSCIPMQSNQLGRVLNWSLWIQLGCILVKSLLGLLGQGGASEMEMSMGEAMQDTRFTSFMDLGSYMVVLLYAMFPLVRFLTNPLLLLGMAAGYGMVLISGFRSVFASNVLCMVFMSMIKREFMPLLGLALISYGGLFVLSSSGEMKLLPLGVQRVMSAVPGLKADQAVTADAEGSSDWRYEMWGWALDSRTGFIKDYVWGDGFGLSQQELQRDQLAMMRLEMRYGDQDQFARSKQWHSLIISAIQSVGYVGLAVVVALVYSTCLLVFKVCSSLRNTPFYVPAMVKLIPITPLLLMFFVSASDMTYYLGLFVTVAQLKLLYCVAREQGLLIPWMQRKRYIPKMIQEYEEKLRPAQ